MNNQNSLFKKLSVFLLIPIQNNMVFFMMTYLLGTICILITDDCVYLPFYMKLFFELFFDLYLICLLFTILPQIITFILKLTLVLFFYLCTIIELFCIIRLNTQISPSIVQLMIETNLKEMESFFTTYFNEGLIYSYIPIIFFMMFLHCYLEIKTKNKKANIPHTYAILVAFLLICGCYSSIDNKKYIKALFTANSVEAAEQYMAQENWATRSLYTPTHRFAFSLHTSYLASNKLKNLVITYKDIIIKQNTDSLCTIVLIIGESYNKHHSQLYGYKYETTPKQKKLQESGKLYVFQDAVTPYNLTSYAFINLFSTNNISAHEQWTDYPLFTQIFHKAGFNVTFITNQYVKNKDKEFFDFSGGIFLNNDQMESTQFNHRNTRIYNNDVMLLAEYDSLKRYNTNKNLIIFHLLGQHFNYRERFPKDSLWFKPSLYVRKDLKESDKQIIANYDNATRYNDYIVYKIIEIFKNENAIVLYIADHGEECFDEIKDFGRTHKYKISKEIAKNEFQIPFWIWCSQKYLKDHTTISKQIKSSLMKPFFSDDLPHLLLYLGGIETVYYKRELNIIDPNYNLSRKRLLRGIWDYDSIMKQ